jgi:hypothetical protein
MISTGVVPPPVSREMEVLLDEIKVHGEKAKEWKDGAHCPESYVDQKKRQIEELESKNKFFIYNLIANYSTFADSTYFKALVDHIPDLAVKYRRGAVFYLTVSVYLKAKGLHDAYTISHTSLPKVLNDYMVDLAIIKKRYGSEKIQFSKIAGLMANLIVKYRPIVPLDRNNDPKPDINENFAIYHAICICAGYENGAEDIRAFQKSKHHALFYEEAKYLLKRNFTPENLILTFKTLCLYQFPKSLERPSDG